MDLVSAIKGRRSVRRFSERSVEDEKIDKIIDAGQWAPSACNKQMWEFVVVKNDDAKRKIVDHAHAVHFLKNAPVIVFVLYDSRTTPERGANIMSGAAAIQNMLLRAYELGIGSCWVNQIGDESRLKRLLKIPENFTVVSAVALGYPAERPKPPRRRDVNRITHQEYYRKGYREMSIFPDKWGVEEWEDYRKRGIRATSPFPQAHAPRFGKEFETEINLAFKCMKGAEILDLLPFSGIYTAEIARRASSNVHIFETSDEIVDFLKRRLKAMGIKKAIDAKTGSLYRLPYPSKFFDTVLCFKKLEMLPEPERLVSESWRVLKPGGVFILTFWKTRNIFSLNYWLKTRLLGRTNITSNEGPLIPLSAGEVKGMLKRNGFSIEEEYGINLAPRYLGSHPDLEGFSSGGMPRLLCRTIFLKCRKV